jgi:competence ComEA-like helix-hairpin-helix protein
MEVHSMRYFESRKSTCLLLAAILLVLFGLSTNVAAEEKKVLTGKTVNINTGTIEELALVPLVSQELAEAIVEYREENGDFQVIEELLQVDGFSRNLLRRVKTFLLLEGIGGDECTC